MGNTTIIQIAFIGALFFTALIVTLALTGKLKN